MSSPRKQPFADSTVTARKVNVQARRAAEPHIERIVVNPASLDFDEEEAVASHSAKRAGSSSSRKTRD